MTNPVNEKPQLPLTPGISLEGISRNQSDLVVQLQRVLSEYGFVINKVAAKADDVISVKDFGAIGDSVVDDTAAIQAAIDKAEADFKGHVYIPTGNYRVTSPLTVTASQITISGDAGATVIIGDHQGDIIQLQKSNATKISNLLLSNFIIGFTTDRTTGAAIHVGNIGASRFEGINITNAFGGAPWDGFALSSCSSIFFNNCRVSGCDNDGFVLGIPDATAGENVIDIWFTDCASDNNVERGFLINNTSATLTVEGIYFTRCSVFGNKNGLTIAVSGGAANNNYFVESMILDSSTDNGFIVSGTSAILDLRLIDVWSSNNGEHGIFLNDQVSDWNIVGGMVLFNGKSGITADGSRGKVTGVSIFDNNQDNVGEYGINVKGDYIMATGNRVYNTTRKSTDQNGIIVAAASTDTEIIGNYIDTGGSSTPYSDSGTRTRAYNNIEDDTLDYTINRAPLTIGNGDPILKHLTGTGTLDFGTVAANTSSDLTITVTGAATEDTVALGVPNGSVVADTSYTAWVSSANTVTVRLNNHATSTSANPASGTFRADVWQH